MASDGRSRAARCGGRAAWRRVRRGRSSRAATWTAGRAEARGRVEDGQRLGVKAMGAAARTTASGATEERVELEGAGSGAIRSATARNSTDPAGSERSRRRRRRRDADASRVEDRNGGSGVWERERNTATRAARRRGRGGSRRGWPAMGTAARTAALRANGRAEQRRGRGGPKCGRPASHGSGGVGGSLRRDRQSRAAPRPRRPKAQPAGRPWERRCGRRGSGGAAARKAGDGRSGGTSKMCP